MSGCVTLLDPPPEAYWATARVVEVRIAADNSRIVRTECAGMTSSASPSPVAIVRYRSANVTRYAAYAIPSPDAVHAGDTVRVNPRLCVLKPVEPGTSSLR